MSIPDNSKMGVDETDDQAFDFAVEIAQAFQPYLEAAVLRLGSQYPSLRFLVRDAVIAVAGATPENQSEIRKAVLHAVYREKIYAETLPMRQALVAAVTAS
jgi:hypothetical protein